MDGKFHLKNWNALLFLFSLLIFCNTTKAQEKNQSFTEFKGIVMDSNTNKALVFADINLLDTNISTITNNEGEFSLKVPNMYLNKDLNIAFLGYKTKVIALSELKHKKNRIKLEERITVLDEISLKAPKDAEALVRLIFKTKGDNYINHQAIMTAFYRETIKNRKKNASLSEAVLEIYKQPYTSNKKDEIKLIKARKNTNYSKLDTLALKLQGGPLSALYADVIKYPEFIFTEDNLSEYLFTFNNTTQINNKKVYVVAFEPNPKIDYPLYYGKLYIDAETFSLTSAIYNLNVKNKKLASAMFVRKKPNRAKVFPTEAYYRVDYRIKDGKWHFGYSNIQLTFKVDWKGKLFNSVYSLNSEMAVTDWEYNKTGNSTPDKKLKSTVILSDEASGFSDPSFWGEYNIIEPEKSIETAIKKIKKQLKKTAS